MDNPSAAYGRLDLLADAIRIVSSAEQCSSDDALALIVARGEKEHRTVEDIAKAIIDDAAD